MILYFDTYITETPLPGRSRKNLREDIRKYCKTYAMPKKSDIAKYSLVSYALYPWKKVFIRYELEDTNGYREFDAFIRRLFPKAIIWHRRSDSQEDYIDSWKILEKLKDNWIFYVPNNDQPLVTSDKDYLSYIKKLLIKANEYEKRYKFVSVIYSFFSEFVNMPVKGSPINLVLGRDTELLHEDELARYYIAKKGCFDAIQIVNKNLFKRWFVDTDLKSKRVIRVEDVEKYAKVKNQLIISPKKEICAHFDKYEHNVGTPSEIQLDLIPPLFIPEGFFSNSVKIAYGYSAYRKGWVNINPAAKKYSFRDNKSGTDLKICLDELPLFWKNHIMKVDINKKADLIELKLSCEKNKKYLSDPWSNLPVNLKTIRFQIRLMLYKTFLKAGIVQFVGSLQKRHTWIYNFIKFIAV